MENQLNIDAAGKKLGRVASQAASMLMGKNRPDFARNKVPAVKVNITNASKIEIRNKKIESKKYITYSGYPGGIKEQALKKVVADRGYAEILKRAVHGMLPSNKLRPVMMKNLIIHE